MIDPMPFRQGPYGDISDALEHATDSFVSACNANAEAENAYLREFHRAWAQSLDVAVSARAKHVDAQGAVTEAKCAWNLAQAHERACRAKCDELKHRLMASMSWQRTVGAQT